MTLTRFGFQLPSFTFPEVADDRLFDVICEAATTAEGSGFDSLWVMDHFYQIPSIGSQNEPMLEAYTLLAGIAARTSSAKIGALVTGVTYRNPALLAKAVTTLDIVSRGRAVLGLGAAWFEAEHDACGFSLPGVGERMDRLEETVQICRAMFTQDETTFSGTHHHVVAALNRPRPVSPGGPPILIGGGGEQRTLKLVAKYADACNVFGDAQTVRHKLNVLDAHCDDIGRDPAEITKTRLGAIVLADTAEGARNLGAELRAVRSMGWEKYDSYVVEGEHDSVLEQVQELFDAGLDGLIFNVHDPTNFENIAEIGSLLKDNFSV